MAGKGQGSHGSSETRGFARCGVEGFWWEFQRAMTMLAPDRIVLLIPFKAPEYETFRRKAEKALPRGLPGYAGKANPPFDLRGLIYFDHDGTAHFAPLAGVMRDIPYYSLRAPLAAPLKEYSALFTKSSASHGSKRFTGFLCF